MANLPLAKLTAGLAAYGPWGVLLLALIDSVGVPLPATLDALLILIAVKAPGRAYLAASLSVLGSLGGNFILFEAARYGLRFLRAEPGKQQRFRRWFQRYGLITVFVPAATPILPFPLKVFVISAGAFHAAPWRFLGVILVARVLRYFGDAYLGIKLGANAQGFLERHAWLLIGIVLAIVVVFYLLIRLLDRRRPGPIS
jgi:membrane protein YqaA with SNARE-associated domain